MRTHSDKNAFPTKITVQTVEVILSKNELFALLGGQSFNCIHRDEGSVVEFHIVVKKDTGVIK